MKNEQNPEARQEAFEEFLADYAKEPHIAKFYHKRSQIISYKQNEDIVVTKDGDSYLAMIGNCLADAKFVGWGDSELRAMMALVEERAVESFADGVKIKEGVVYCVGLVD